jgi:hypothetical protein
MYGSKATKMIIGKYKGYNSLLDALATIEFSTAAFCLHSMVNLPSLFLSKTCEMNQGVLSEMDNPFVKQERTSCDPSNYCRVGHEDVIRGALVQHAQ